MPRGLCLPLRMKKPMGELALIERIRSGWGGAAGDGRRTAGLALGIGDDCAILRPPGATRFWSPPTFRSKGATSAATGIRPSRSDTVFWRGVSATWRRWARVRWPRSSRSRCPARCSRPAQDGDGWSGSSPGWAIWRMQSSVPLAGGDTASRRAGWCWRISCWLGRRLRGAPAAQHRPRRGWAVCDWGTWGRGGGTCRAGRACGR
jgi:hypothetical protein